MRVPPPSCDHVDDHDSVVDPAVVRVDATGDDGQGAVADNRESAVVGAIGNVFT